MLEQMLFDREVVQIRKVLFFFFLMECSAYFCYHKKERVVQVWVVLCGPKPLHARKSRVNLFTHGKEQSHTRLKEVDQDVKKGTAPASGRFQEFSQRPQKGPVCREK